MNEYQGKLSITVDEKSRNNGDLTTLGEELLMMGLDDGDILGEELGLELGLLDGATEGNWST